MLFPCWAEPQQIGCDWLKAGFGIEPLGALVEENDGTGYGLGMEAGRKFAFAPNWSMTPQAQLAWSSVDFDDFTDAFATDVSLDGSDSLVGRLGITADYEAFGQDAEGRITRTHVYGIGNLYYDFEDGSTVDMAGVELASENEALWGGIGIGGTYNWADDKYSVYGEALARTSLENFGDSHVPSVTCYWLGNLRRLSSFNRRSSVVHDQATHMAKESPLLCPHLAAGFPSRRPDYCVWKTSISTGLSRLSPGRMAAWSAGSTPRCRPQITFSTNGRRRAAQSTSRHARPAWRCWKG
jgi:hypothetical protein